MASSKISVGLLSAIYRHSKPKYNRAESVKGECYHNVFNFMMENRTGWTAVHGIATGQGPIRGVKHGHAWVETVDDGYDWVYDPSSDVLVQKEYYYQEGKILESSTIRYDADKFIAEVLESETSGPWNKEIAEAHYPYVKDMV